MPPAPVLYFDLSSPYAYLAVHRAASVLGVAPVLEPVLLGALFGLRGHGSWADTPTREIEMAEVEARAERYGMAALVWPAGWPQSSLTAMRAATFASRDGAAEPFAREVFTRVFAAGGDITDPELLREAAIAAGLNGDETLAATAATDVKDALKDATAAAWAAGVRGVPVTRVGSRVFYGDDRLELAAEAMLSA